MSLIIKYSLFAIIATAINLLFQFISFNLYQGIFDLYIGMFIGTAAGLVVKYVLDKKYIFYYQVKNTADDGVKFILYSLMGVITTFVFWGFEIAFDFVFAGDIAKYIGAIIGLSIGYVVKYFLDKKFVFKKVNFNEI